MRGFAVNCEGNVQLFKACASAVGHRRRLNDGFKADCGRSSIQESTTAVIETGLCEHSRPTADICVTMMQQLGVSHYLIGRCQNLVVSARITCITTTWPKGVRPGQGWANGSRACLTTELAVVLLLAGVTQFPFHTGSLQRSATHKAGIHASGGELQARLRSDPPSSSESAFALLDDPGTAR